MLDLKKADKCTAPALGEAPGLVLSSSSEPPYKVGFYLLPAFSLMAFASAIEPLRAANRLAGRALYEWKLYSRDGEPVSASNGISVAAHASITDPGRPQMMIVCAGLYSERFDDRAAFGWLRRLARGGCRIGALSTGAYVLAYAGLLDGRRCATHWESAASLGEQFPEVRVTDDIYVIDDRFCTCSGGTASLDMMLHIIAADHGRKLANDVSEQFIHPRIREHHDKQRMEVQTRLGISHPKLISVIGIMEQAIEDPLDLETIAVRVGLSTRQLERLFAKYLKTSPNRHYLELRLSHGRALLLQTSRSIMEIAVACGFVSVSHFSKCYKHMFDRKPSDERQLALVAAGPARSYRSR